MNRMKESQLPRAIARKMIESLHLCALTEMSAPKCTRCKKSPSNLQTQKLHLPVIRLMERRPLKFTKTQPKKPQCHQQR
jgi:hypothetical protein